MKKIEIKLYEFSELSETAKETAINNWLNCGMHHDWWECVCEDAANVWITINSFDIGRGSYCNITFVESPCMVAEKIKSEHGVLCETWKTANNFLAKFSEIQNSLNKAIHDLENNPNDIEAENLIESLDSDKDELEDEFKKSISEDFRILLQNEYEYQTSEAYIIETIEANEYDFTEDGKMY